MKKGWMAVAVLGLVCGVAQAEKPSWAGHGKHKEGKSHSAASDASGQGSASVTFSFSSEDRRIISEYFGAQARQGKCPPGLAKKNNGCLPPGQAKKWQKGHALDKDVVVLELPKELRVKLPVPPVNHRYVRIAGDILLIAAGTRMVVDAVEDILK